MKIDPIKSLTSEKISPEIMEYWQHPSVEEISELLSVIQNVAMRVDGRITEKEDYTVTAGPGTLRIVGGWKYGNR